jgi:hypothetical protein
MTAHGYFLNIMALSSLFSSYGDLYNFFSSPQGRLGTILLLPRCFFANGLVG